MRRVVLPIALVLSALLTSMDHASAGTLALLVKDASGRAVSDAVVYATPPSGARGAGARTSRAAIDQVDREFVPHVKPVQVGTEVLFPNKDNIRHHVYSFSPAKTFELPLYRGTPANPVRFDRPGVVVLGCNIHDWMLGYVLVLETLYFETTGSEGMARLQNLPPGTYEVRVWHARMKDTDEPATRRVTIPAGQDEQQIQFSLGLKPEWRPRRPAAGPGNRYR